MTDPNNESSPVPVRVKEFLGGHLVPPQLVMNPETGGVGIVSAGYSFEPPFAKEYERIARAASAASGVVPSAEDLTAEAVAQAQAARESAAQEPVESGG